MIEFEIRLRQEYYGKTVSDFISGYWQNRIQELYTVREEEIERMERILGNVQTSECKLPTRFEKDEDSIIYRYLASSCQETNNP